MKFVKMHGIGNDYVYLDAYTDPSLERRDLAGLARRMSDRHRGIGSDGLILVCRPASDAGVPAVPASVRMRMFNADGSESEMCGNGVRCVAKFAHDRLGIRERPMQIQTGRGLLSIDYSTLDGRLTTATVDMGEPIIEPDRIPVDAARLASPSRRGDSGVVVGRIVLDSFGPFDVVLVSMGNPHAVCFDVRTLDGLARLELDRIGPRMERHPAFPNRTNVHFVAIQSHAEATMRTWERGAGLTQACGTGACAVLVAGVLTDRLDREATLHLPGGGLQIRWDAAMNHVHMTGPAEEVFDGEWRE